MEANEVEEFNLVISCVGQLNQPKIPEINGLESFEGNIFHSARWPQDDQITGKKVAVIGSGASAFQIVPSIADKCRRTHCVSKVSTLDVSESRLSSGR